MLQQQTKLFMNDAELLLFINIDIEILFRINVFRIVYVLKIKI